MAVKTEKELSEDQRAHWLKAVAALELRNFGYAISLLQGILKQEPQFLTGRQLLLRTEVTRLKAAKYSQTVRLFKAWLMPLWRLGRIPTSSMTLVTILEIGYWKDQG